MVWDKIRQIGRYCFGSTNHATATATIVIAIVTTIYAVVSGLQWRAMNRANEINADSLYQIQRPFIFATNMEMVPINIPNQPVSFDLNPAIQNGGNTPPKTLLIYINYYTPTDSISPDYKFPDLDDVVVASSPGGPKVPARVPTKNFSLDSVTEFRNKTRHLYIYGHIEYDDTFKNTPHHFTLYCFQLAGIRGADPRNLASGVVGTIAFDFPVCRKHNCADEACKSEQ